MEDYKVGQKIVINMRREVSIQPPYKIEEITKITATQITTSDGRRYMKSTHNEVGNRWHDYSIAYNYFSNPSGLMTEKEAAKANQEWEEENKITIMRNFIRYMAWKEVPATKIEQIYKILKGE